MLRIISPPASFVKFSTTPEDHCVYGVINPPLPVVYSSDVAFQVMLVGDTEAEVSAVYNDAVNFGIVRNEGDEVFLLQFPNTATRSKKSPTQILYNWGAGFPGFESVIDIGECFRVMIQLGDDSWWSNPFKRISVNDEVCFTTVISYANESGGFGFFDCGPIVDPGTGAPVDEDGNCIPMVVEFANVPNITIPITTEMVEKYGEIPSFQSWLYDTNGNLYNAGISAQLLGGYPPNAAVYDFGGNASGVIRVGN